MSGLRDQLQVIHNQEGRLTPSLVVDHARDPEHPLHHRFEWDDRIAGEAHRREQARKLIRECRMVYRESKDGPMSVRCFPAIRGNDQAPALYEPIEEVLADDFKRMLLFREMQRRWRAFKAEYAMLDEFWQMIRGDAGGPAA